jgi:hypothetical protein
MSGEVFMTWLKGDSGSEQIAPNKVRVWTAPPPPSIIQDYIDVKPSDKVDSFVEEAVRFYSLMLCINGMPKDIAMKLAKPEHYALHIDGDSDPDNYLLSVVEVVE